MENDTKTPEEQLHDALYQLKWGIEYIEKALKALPNDVKSSVDDSCEYGYKTLAKKISSSLDDVKKFEETLQSERNKVIDELDKTWRAISDKHEEIQKRIERIQERTIKVDTYRMKEVLELLSRLEGYDSKTWERFEAICSKLKHS